MKRVEDRRRLSTAERIAALSRVGVALMLELNETRLLHFIAQTACELTGAAFAAFDLRPLNKEGQPLVPSEGNRFHLAAVVGVTPKQEAFFRHMPSGGEGLLAPIFHQGVSVLVADVLAFHSPSGRAAPSDLRHAAREAAEAYALGKIPTESLRSLGIPPGHPQVRSLLGVPVLDSQGGVRGGLLLGHNEPGRFTLEDEAILVGLAAQAAVALENAELYRVAQRRSQVVERIFAAIGDGILLVDELGSILYENAAAHQMRELLEGTPGERQAIEALLRVPAQHALRKEEVKDALVQLVDKHGEAREYAVSASLLPLPLVPTGPFSLDHETTQSANGSMDILLIWHDATERCIREAEHQTRNHAKQLEMVIEAIADAVIFAYPDGQVVYANAAVRSSFTPNPTMNHTATIEAYVAAAYPRDPAGQPLEPAHIPFRRVLNGEVLTGNRAVDLLLRTNEGQDRLFNVSGTPVWDPNGKLLGALMISRDVTEHRRLEQVEHEARAEMEDRLATLQLILDELPSGVFLIYGHDARLVLANRAALAVLGAYWPPGQPMEEFLNHNGIGIFDIHGHPVAFEQLAVIRAVRRGETVPQFQSITRQPNGTAISTLVSAVAFDAHRLKLPLLQTGGPPAEEPAYVALVTYEDVTILKEAERLKDEFIGIAAHELRNPLTVLSGYVQMLLFQNKRGKGPKLLPTQEEALQSIDRSTTELVELTEDLLDVTRLQGGGWQLNFEPTELVALIQRTVKHLQTTTKKHTLSIVTTLPSLVVYADPGRIEQVLSNLIGNAIKYSPDGGPIEITLWEAMDTQEARLSVRDGGIGIPEKDQARIFGHFARASNADTYKISGTGFGLYLCRELIARHNGRIWFESKEGQGSTFFMALPLTS
jgi:signal transduction histidine kinase/GAF domain-containing protein